MASSPKKKPSLGDLEMDVLRFVTEQPSSLSVRAVSEQYGEPRGLARTTILTVMERLRKKGYLERSPSEGVFHYSPRHSQQEVTKGLIRAFVEKALGGSVSPLVAYLAQEKEFTEAEIAELRDLADRLGRSEEEDR